jgi:hypothetical protein
MWRATEQTTRSWELCYPVSYTINICWNQKTFAAKLIGKSWRTILKTFLHRKTSQKMTPFTLLTEPSPKFYDTLHPMELNMKTNPHSPLTRSKLSNSAWWVSNEKPHSSDSKNKRKTSKVIYHLWSAITWRAKEFPSRMKCSIEPNQTWTTQPFR